MDTDMFDTVPEALNPVRDIFLPRTVSSSQNCPRTHLPDVDSSITYSPSAQLTDLGFFDDLALVPLDVVPLEPADRTIELERCST